MDPMRQAPGRCVEDAPAKRPIANRPRVANPPHMGGSLSTLKNDSQGGMVYKAAAREESSLFLRSSSLVKNVVSNSPATNSSSERISSCSEMLVSTMNDLPGYRVVRVFGEVFGLTVRSRNVFCNFGANLKAMAGGELRGLSKLLSDSRYEALHRLSQEAMQHGANAVLALRFDCNEIAGMASEIAAYGTAVYVVPDGAPQQPPQPQPQVSQQG